jgi:hypothetical protein
MSHFRKEKAILINIYYHSPKNGDYLHHVVDSSGIGRVKDCQNLEGLNGDHTADVVLLEYQDNNPALDSWIAQTTAQPGCPDIFLFVEEVSPPLHMEGPEVGCPRNLPLRHAARRIAGRDITAGDAQGHPCPAIINLP